MINQISQHRIYGIWGNCLEVTNTDYLDYKGTFVAGDEVVSYEWQYSNPRPYVDVATNKVKFYGSGKVWNIYIKNGVTNKAFLYCCEGSGNDALNQTVHNGYAGNTTDHFLVNSATKWKKTFRDDIYKWGWSTKTALSLIVEKVTNGSFASNIVGWTNSPIQAKTSSSWSSNYTGSARVTVSSNLVDTDNASFLYQDTGSIVKIFRYIALVETNNSHVGVSGDRWIFMSEGNYASDVKYVVGVGYAGTTSFVTAASNPGVNVPYTFSRKWYATNNIFIDLPGGASTTINWYYPDVSVKIYEDDIKIPSLMTDRNKDCLGNTLTTDLL